MPRHRSGIRLFFHIYCEYLDLFLIGVERLMPVHRIIAAVISFIVFIFILPFPPLFKSISTAMCFLACILVLISVLWQHTASVAAGVLATNLGNGTLFSGVGVTAMVMGWLSFGMMTVSAIGLYYFVMINDMVARIEDRV